VAAEARRVHHQHHPAGVLAQRLGFFVLQAGEGVLQHRGAGGGRRRGFGRRGGGGQRGSEDGGEGGQGGQAFHGDSGGRSRKAIVARPAGPLSRHGLPGQSLQGKTPILLECPVTLEVQAMLYPELFKQLESVRWDMDKDIPWDKFDAALLTEEQAQTVKMNAITEWAALPATEMFLRDNRNDSDFSAFMSIWFFEEQKHSLVLM